MARHTVCCTDMPTLEFPDDFSYEIYREEEQSLYAKWVKKLAAYQNPIDTPIYPEVLK